MLGLLDAKRDRHLENTNGTLGQHRYITDSEFFAAIEGQQIFFTISQFSALQHDGFIDSIFIR